MNAVGLRPRDGPLLKHECQASGQQDHHRGDKTDARDTRVERRSRRRNVRRFVFDPAAPHSHAPTIPWIVLKLRFSAGRIPHGAMGNAAPSTPWRNW